jgi:hypothetical protein
MKALAVFPIRSLIASLLLLDLTSFFTQEGPRLPYELLGLIAQHLQNEIEVEGFRNLLHTLANLNRVSRAVHEVTLPYLYHRTAYIHNRSFTCSVLTQSVPKGWKYTKYVLIICYAISGTDTAEDICT